MSAKIGLFLLLLGMSSPLHAQSLDRSTERLAARVLPVTVTVTVKTNDGTVLGNGSGFVVARNRIVTNLHVVAEAGRTQGALVTVRFANGQSKAVSGVSDIDALSDIALLVVDTGSVHQLPFGGAAKIGQAVMAVGSPRGLGGSVSTGIVSARRAYRGIEILQVTAPISPGSSGGVLVDGTGNVIGITSFYFKDSQNINFAYSASRITQMLKKKTSTRMSWATLGREIDVPATTDSAEENAEPQLTFNQAYQRGCRLLSDERYDESEKYLRMAVRLKAQSAEAHANLAECLDKMGKKKEAVKELAEVAKLHGTFDAYGELGLAYEKVEDPENAYVSYKKALYLLSQQADVMSLENATYDFSIRWLLARAYYTNDKVDAALEQYRANYKKVDRLFTFVPEQAQKTGKEEADVKSGVNLLVGGFMEEFGTALARQAVYTPEKTTREEVLEIGTKAVEYNPKGDRSRFVYGIALFMVGRKQEAVEQWKIVAKSSDKDMADKALEYLSGEAATKKD